MSKFLYEKLSTMNDILHCLFIFYECEQYYKLFHIKEINKISLG